MELSAGKRNVINCVLKKAKTTLIAPIIYLCNLSISTGILPECFKIAYIFPINKTGNSGEPSNNKPCVSRFKNCRKNKFTSRICY